MSAVTKCDRAICQVITPRPSLGKKQMHFHFLLLGQRGLAQGGEPEYVWWKILTILPGR